MSGLWHHWQHVGALSWWQDSAAALCCALLDSTDQILTASQTRHS